LDRLQKPKFQFLILSLLALAIVAVYSVTLATMSRWYKIQLVGPLQFPADLSPQARPWGTFHILLLSCAVATLVCLWIGRVIRKSTPPRGGKHTPDGGKWSPVYLRYTVIAASSLLWLQIPLFYGTVLHPTSYPLVKIPLAPPDPSQPN